MLPKTRKLNSTEHKKVLSLGARKHSSVFTLYYLKKENEETKCAVVMPKKVSKKAVLRNKNKRKVFDTITNIYPHILPEYHFVLMARTKIETLSHEVLLSEVKSIFRQSLN